MTLNYGMFNVVMTYLDDEDGGQHDSDGGEHGSSRRSHLKAAGGSMLVFTKPGGGQSACSSLPPHRLHRPLTPPPSEGDLIHR